MVSGLIMALFRLIMIESSTGFHVVILSKGIFCDSVVGWVECNETHQIPINGGFHFVAPTLQF